MHAAIESLFPYIERTLAEGTRLHAITRHLVGAFHGVSGARAFRRALAENCTKVDAGLDSLRRALDAVPRAETVQAAAAA
jgi:tRNA-dihydrouridine synthase A